VKSAYLNPKVQLAQIEFLRFAVTNSPSRQIASNARLQALAACCSRFNV
jgi:hypothetical protein